jgi:hypothetical protein
MMQATKILNHFVGRLTRRARRAGLAALSLAVAALLVFNSSTASAQAIPLTGAVGITIVGVIKAITLDTPGDAFSSGTISIGTSPFAVAGDYTVSIPRNLLLDVPNKDVLTLQQFVQGAKVSGLPIEGVGLATILANRLADGRIIAGSVAIQKGNEFLTGEVTFINHTDGYLRINGTPNADIGGTIVRFNDPAGVYSIQQGLGCSALGGPNCSPDTRFGAHPTSYTIVFATGMPACIPSTVTNATRSTGSSPTGVGDPFCPATNRSATSNVVADSTRFAPIRVGDSLTAAGNYETVNLVTFLSAWSIQVSAKLLTRNVPTQPDYMQFSETRWEVPGFPLNRIRARFFGSGTDPAPVAFTTPRFDIFAVHRGQDNVAHEFPLASSVNNVNAFLGVPGSQLFRILYDIDFNLLAVGINRAELSACGPLTVAGFASVCPLGGTLEEETRIVSPAAREIIGRTRHQKELSPGVVARNIQGAVTPTGEYLMPTAIEFPTFIEVDTALLATPFIFEGIPWNLDRRVGVGGCVGPCPSVQIPLSPFSISGLDPRTQISPLTGQIVLPAAVRNQPIAFFPFGGPSGNVAVGLLTIPLVP